MVCHLQSWIAIQMDLEGENCESPRIMDLDNASWLGITAVTSLVGGHGHGSALIVQQQELC